MRYFIIRTRDLDIEEVKDDSWFSNPIKKMGEDHELMCKIDAFGGYDAKNSWASKRHYYAEFFVRGQKSSFRLKGWNFPSEIRRATDSSSRDARWFNEFSFVCTRPNGDSLNVNVKVNEPYIWGIMKAISALINMSESMFDTYSYSIGNERCITLDSYIYYNQYVKAYPL